MKLTVDKRFALVSFLLIFIYLVLEVYYVTFLSENFNYLGFKYDFSLVKYMESKELFILFMILSWMVYKRSQFIYAIYVLLLLFFFIPNAIMFAFMDHIRGPIYSICFLLFSFAAIATRKLSVPVIKAPFKLKFILLFCLGGTLLIPILLRFGVRFNLNTLLLKDIYATRDAFAARSTTLVDYFYGWEVKTIVPVLLVFFLIMKRYFLAALSFLILLYLYVISGNKAVYMASIVTLFFYYAGSKTYSSKISSFLAILVVCLIIIPIIDVFMLDDFLLRGILVMRPFFFPALLNYCYFDFFAHLPMYFSENHIFNHFFHSPLPMKSAYLISRVYFNTKDMYANNGIITDGFMNLGYAGVAILSLLFSLIFMFFNSIDIDRRYFGIFLIYIFFFLSVPMFSVLLSGGLWLLVLLALTVMKSNIASS